MFTRRQIVGILGFCLALTLIASSTVEGRGQPDWPTYDPISDPGDPVCPDEEWPHYYYRHPVLFQEVTHQGTLKFVAFAYADACKSKDFGPGQRAGTKSFLQELPRPYWEEDALQKMAALQPQAAGERIPDYRYPGSNVYRWSLPEIPAYGFNYDDFFRQPDPDSDLPPCPTSPDGAVVCPGVHPDFARDVLGPAGWESFQYSERTIWKIGGGDSVDAWFGSAVPTNGGENFWARHFAEDMKANHGDGGFIRVILHPVDLELVQVPEETPIQEGGTAVITATINNHSTRRSLQTEIGWRLQGESGWQPVTGWRHQGESGWRPAAEPIPLTAKGATPIEVMVSGAVPGQVIELMVNHTHTIPEADKWEGPHYSAYLNNVAATTIAGVTLDLAVTALQVPTSLPCADGGTYTARWVIHNNTDSPITVRRKASVTTGKSGAWTLGERTVTLQPGDNEERATVHTLRCDDLYTVQVEVNPEPRAVEETTYENNLLVRQTVLAPDEAPSSLPSFQSGTGKTVIVPSDCVPNPDATSDHPCLNYPYLRISP